MKNIEIKKILVPVDFSETSEAATATAITLAKQLKAEIFLLHVTEIYQYNYSFVPETAALLPSILELEKEIQKKMDELKENTIKKYGITPEVYVTIGDIHSEIIGFCKKKEIGLIVMGTHGTSGYSELFMGSNAQRVVTLSDIPVLTLQKKSDKPGFKSILIPIDNSLHSREKINLAMIIADLFDAEIHVLGLPDSSDEEDLKKFTIKYNSVQKIIALHKLTHKITMIQGDNLAEEALKYATKNKCDLIVINTGHESKFTGIFLGTFAQQIVNHSKIPVLSFKHTENHTDIETPGYGIG